MRRRCSAYSRRCGWSSPGSAGFRPMSCFTDRTLIDMARRRPRTEAEFAEVNGVGAAKLRDFSEPFLAAIEAALSDPD